MYSKVIFFFPPSIATPIPKKAKKARRGNVTFDQVTVFFFPRCQGFTSVPSRGGCTLGMQQHHSMLRTYTLAEFAVEQRLLRREKLLNRLREEKLEALKMMVSSSALSTQIAMCKFVTNSGGVMLALVFSWLRMVPKRAPRLSSWPWTTSLNKTSTSAEPTWMRAPSSSLTHRNVDMHCSKQQGWKRLTRKRRGNFMSWGSPGRTAAATARASANLKHAAAVWLASSVR